MQKAPASFKCCGRLCLRRQAAYVVLLCPPYNGAIFAPCEHKASLKAGSYSVKRVCCVMANFLGPMAFQVSLPRWRRCGASLAVAAPGMLEKPRSALVFVSG